MANPRLNNLDAIRLGAALTVLVGHAWPLTGRGSSPSLVGIPLFTLAVWVFFAVSGYLITTSWNRSPVAIAFLTRRALRIFPALALVVVFTTFVVGPLVSDLEAGEYFADPGSWLYLTNVTLVSSYDLPGVFSEHPRTAVNGSLWTLGPEFCCYLGVLALGMGLRVFRHSLRPRAQVVGWAAFAVLLALASFLSPESTALPETAAAMTFFAIGAFLACTFSHRVLPLFPLIILLPGWLIVSSAVPLLALPLARLVVPYSVLAVGLRSTIFLRRAGRLGDFSYGIYLWGFIAQQVLFHYRPDLPFWLNLAIVVPGTVVIAAGSWYLIERRAIAFSRRVRPV